MDATDGATQVAVLQPMKTTTDYASEADLLQLTLGQGGGYNLAAKASFGKVSSNLAIENKHHNVNTRNGQLIESLITGRILGTGNCDLRLVSSHGDIDISKGAR